MILRKPIFLVLNLLIGLSAFSQFAQPDQITTVENTPVVIDVRNNDGYSTSYYMTTHYQDSMGVILIPPSNGSYVILNNYSIMYTPDPDYIGKDEFVYGIAIYDKLSFSIDTARVYVDILPPDSVACNAGFTFQVNPQTNQVSFHGFNTFLFPGNTNTFHWDFGDSTYSNVENPLHYFHSGIGYVCLTITTSNGCSSTYCDSIIIANTNCDAHFLYEPANCQNCYQFQDASVGDIVDWQWDFDDYFYSYNQNPNHVFPDSGIYHVCLTVHSSQNCVSTHCENIYNSFHSFSQTLCHASFSYHKNTADSSGMAYIFSDFSMGNVVAWQWDFGDGDTSDVKNPVHSYSTPGMYQVCLKIFTVDSCTSSYCHLLVVESPVTCQSQFSNNIGQNYLTINFLDETPGSPISWLWKFGDGDSSTLQNPEHVFPDTGIYNVCLYTFFENGEQCASCYDINISVTPNTLKNFCGLVYAGNDLLPSGVVIVFDVDEYYRAKGIVALSPVLSGVWCFIAPVRNYLIYAIPFYDYDLNFNKRYFPTYYGDKMFWNEAIVYNSDSQVSPEIHLEYAFANPDFYGNGSIEAHLIHTCDSTYEETIYDLNWNLPGEQQNPQTSSNARNMPVLLLDENNNPITFKLSDAEGKVKFNNLAMKNYKLYTEKAGLQTLPLNVQLTDQQNSRSDLHINIGGTSITSIFSPSVDLTDDLNMKAFPVPVSNLLNVTFNIESPDYFTITVTNCLGEKINSLETEFQKGKQTITIDFSEYPSGIYLFTLHSKDGRNFMKKIIK